MLSALSVSAADWNVVSMAPNPADKVVSVSDFNAVRINFGTDWAFTVADGAQVTLVNEEAGISLVSTKCQLWDFTLGLTGEYYLDIAFDTPTANGTYVLTVPAGTMTHDGVGNPVLQYTYTVEDPSLDTQEVPELQLLSASPVAGTELPSVGLPDEGRAYTFDTNINKYVAYVTADWYDITDAANPEWIAMTDADHEAGSDSEIVVVRNGNYEKMYEGHTYRMDVVCYNSYQMPRKELGRFSVEYKGSTPQYVYASQKAIAVSPDPSTYMITSAENARFTVSFDGSVIVDEGKSKISLGPLGTQSYGSITSNEAKTEWTFTIPESMLKDENSFVCFVLATDSEGRTVLGDENMAKYQNGSEEGAGFMFDYKSDMNGALLTVTPAEGDVSSLKTFTITTESKFNDMMPSWMAKPYLVRNRDIVYTFTLEGDADTSTPGTVVLTLPEEQTEPGRYSLVIPSNTFMCENSMSGESIANKATMVNYTIGGDEPDETVFDFTYSSVDPAAGNVAEIAKVTFTFAEDVSIVLYDAYILDTDGNEVRKADIKGDFSDWKIAYMEFEPVTEPGDYVLYIPKGSLGDEAFGAGEGGHANDDIRLSYTIEPAGIGSVAGETLRGDVYNVAGVLVLRDADSDAVKTLDKGIYIVGGKKVVVK